MNSKKLEFWGLILVLLSSFVQFFILSKSQDITNGAIIYKIETKLDKIFMASKSNFQVLHLEPDERTMWVNPTTFNSYKYAEQNENMSRTKSQTEWFGNVVALFFVLGSFLIIWAKKLEIDAEKKVSSQPRL